MDATTVCVKDNVSLAYFPKAVGDEITITEAYFDPNAQSLSVKALSSDELAQPTLTLGGFADLANGGSLDFLSQSVTGAIAASLADAWAMARAGWSWCGRHWTPASCRRGCSSRRM